MKIRILHLPHRLDLVSLRTGDCHPLVGEIKRHLAIRGIYIGEVNCSFDNDTAEAVSRFQESEKLLVSGEIDAITFCHLQQAAETEVAPLMRPIARPRLARPNIHINKSQRQLNLLDGNTILRQYSIAIGKPGTPTPEGNFAVATKIMNPGGVLGTRWMGLNYDAYGIHGTNKPWLIGQMVSNGCIRMHNPNAEELFHLINVGTPVIIRN